MLGGFIRKFVCKSGFFYLTGAKTMTSMVKKQKQILKSTAFVYSLINCNFFILKSIRTYLHIGSFYKVFFNYKTTLQ